MPKRRRRAGRRPQRRPSSSSPVPWVVGGIVAVAAIIGFVVLQQTGGTSAAATRSLKGIYSVVNSKKAFAKRLTITERTFEYPIPNPPDLYEHLGDSRILVKSSEGGEGMVFKYHWEGQDLILTDVETGVRMQLVPKR